MLLLFLHGQGASTPQPTLCRSACGQSLPPASSLNAFLQRRNRQADELYRDEDAGERWMDMHSSIFHFVPIFSPSLHPFVSLLCPPICWRSPFFSPAPWGQMTELLDQLTSITGWDVVNVSAILRTELKWSLEPPHGVFVKTVFDTTTRQNVHHWELINCISQLLLVAKGQMFCSSVSASPENQHSYNYNSNSCDIMSLMGCLL